MALCSSNNKYGSGTRRHLGALLMGLYFPENCFWLVISLKALSAPQLVPFIAVPLVIGVKYVSLGFAKGNL